VQRFTGPVDYSEIYDIDYSYDAPYVWWLGEKIWLGSLVRVANGGEPISFEELQQCWFWEVVEEEERKRVAKYWDHVEDYWELK